MWVTRNKLTGSASSMPVPNQVRCFAPTMAAIAGWRLRALPSANTWSFPPRPHTHHVRWIEADVSVADRVFVAIEAGALVRTFDGGRIWRDRVRGGPYDTHTALTHPLAPGRITRPPATGTLKASMLRTR